MKHIDDPAFDPQEFLDRLNLLSKRFGCGRSLVGKFIFPPRPVPPSVLYKFTSSEIAIQHILESCTLRYTQSEVLDDIFEEGPSRQAIREAMPTFEDGPTFVIDVYDPEERLAMFDRVKAARDRLRSEGTILQDDVAILTSDGVHREWRYELGNQPLKEDIEKKLKPLALSLTPHIDSILMWSLYANSHHGVAFAFNTRHRYFQSNRDLVSKAGFFAPIAYRRLTVEDYAYLYPFERFFVKTEEWKYQQEWRRIEFVRNSFDVEWKSAIYTFPFPPCALVGVVFGARTSTETIDYVKGALKANPDLRDVAMMRAVAGIGRIQITELDC